MEPDGKHLRVMRELVNVIVRPLSPSLKDHGDQGRWMMSEKGKHHAHLSVRQKGGSGETQAGEHIHCTVSMHRALPKHLVDNNVVSALSTVFLVLLSTDLCFAVL